MVPRWDEVGADERTFCPARYDVEAIRASSRSWRAEVYGKPLVYLDNAASAQKPRAVIDAMMRTHGDAATPTSIAACTTLANETTEAYEGARETVRALPQRRLDRRDRLHPTAHRGDQPRRRSLRPMAHRGGRRDRALRAWSTTPTSCPGTSCASGKGAVLKWVPVDDDGTSSSTPSRSCLAAHQDRRDHPHVQRARHGDAGERDRRASPTRTACRCCSTAPGGGAPRRSTCSDSTSISTSSPATSSTARPASACSTASANGWPRCRPTRAAAR